MEQRPGSDPPKYNSEIRLNASKSSSDYPWPAPDQKARHNKLSSNHLVILEVIGPAS